MKSCWHKYPRQRPAFEALADDFRNADALGEDKYHGYERGGGGGGQQQQQVGPGISQALVNFLRNECEIRKPPAFQKKSSCSSQRQTHISLFITIEYPETRIF